MLFEAAILFSSASVIHAAEAFSLPEISIDSTSISSSEVYADRFSPVDDVKIGAAGAVDPAGLPTFSGLTVLQHLSQLPLGERADFISRNEGALAAFAASRPAPSEVTRWWTSTGIGARSALINSAPAVIGNLEGVPFALRDYANRRSLELAEQTIAAGVTTGSRSQQIEAGSSSHMLEQVRHALVAPAGGDHRYLLGLDTAGAGTASIVIGDLESADYVSYLVPGMFYSADGQMVAWTAAAQGLHDAQENWVARLGADDPTLADATVATVAWIGYETPSMVNFTSLELAYDGRDAIAAAVAGLQDLRGENQPYISVVAHSYGSTAAMMALTDSNMKIDSLALIGSPGSSASTAAELNVPGGNVYVGEAEWDQVKDTAFFGADPGSVQFGAHSFSVDGGTDPVTGASLLGSTGHGAYLDVDSESLRNLALISLGRGYLVTTDSGAAPVSRAFAGVR